MIDNNFSLVSIKNEQTVSEGRHYLDLEFRWLAHKNMDKLYAMLMTLKRDGKEQFKRYKVIGYAVYPTVMWLSDQLIMEKYRMLLPDPQPGEYTLEAKIVSYNYDEEGKNTEDDVDFVLTLTLAQFSIPVK